MIKKSVMTVGNFLYNLSITKLSIKKIVKSLGEQRIKKILKTAGLNIDLSGSISLEPAIIKNFIDSDCGKDYGITPKQKEKLVELFIANLQKIPSGTSHIAHVIMAQEIMSINPGVKGDVIECGCWKGASTTSLSLICKLVGRRLLVCDSFEGLPDEGLKLHVGMHFGNYGYYKQGMFCGSFNEVKENIENYGDINSCEFIKGFFKDSLKELSDPIIFAFLDVDLVDSTYDCLKYIWPLLQDNCSIYTDDAGDIDVVRCFFDDIWWKNNFNCLSPGYVGSGCGLPVNMQFSSLGYTKKITKFEPALWKRSNHLYYPEELSVNHK